MLKLGWPRKDTEAKVKAQSAIAPQLFYDGVIGGGLMRSLEDKKPALRRNFSRGCYLGDGN